MLDLKILIYEKRGCVSAVELSWKLLSTVILSLTHFWTNEFHSLRHVVH